MNIDNILITGGCGFVGSSMAISFRNKHPEAKIWCLDNLKRRGSELNIERLKEHDISFIHGDVRNSEDLESIHDIDIILECSAEPSVLAGFSQNPEYIINTNLYGTINCLELARKNKAAMIFLSTSRVYPYETINSLNYEETESRYELSDEQRVQGASNKGFTEKFPLDGPRSLYGATKLSSELIIQEYVEAFGLKAVINRCGVIAGPWQFGKVDQGFMAYWVANHHWKKGMSYIGYGGEGKQVRDILHIDDLYNLIKIEIENFDMLSGQIFNVGGGREVSVSLKELTDLCAEITGNRIDMDVINENRPADIRIYLTDNSKINEKTGWEPEKQINDIVYDIYNWLNNNDTDLKRVLL